MCFTGSNFFFGQWYVFPLTVGYIHANAGQLLDPTTIGIHPIPLIPLLSIKKMVVFHSYSSYVISQCCTKKKGHPHKAPTSQPFPPDSWYSDLPRPASCLAMPCFLLFLCQEISMYIPPKKHGSTIWKLNNEVTQAWSMSYVRPNSYFAGSCGLIHAVSAFSVDAMH